MKEKKHKGEYKRKKRNQNRTNKQIHERKK